MTTKLFKTAVSSILMIAIALSTIVFSGTVSAENDLQDKITATLCEKMTTNPSKKIPVYLWYKDINRSELATKIKNETGIFLEQLDTDLKMPEDALINSINELSNKTIQSDSGYISIKNEIERYLEQTRVEREYERTLTNDYLLAERRISKSLYAKKSKDVISDISLKSERILFDSKYAPMIITEMTESEIIAASKSSLIEEIGYYSEPEEVVCSNDTYKTSTGLDKLYTDIGLTGEGVKVGMFEVGHPDSDAQKEYTIVQADGDDCEVIERKHASNTINALAGPQGVAPDTEIYSTNSNFKNIELMLDYGVQVINCSFGWVTSGDEVYSIYDKWFDHLVSQHGVTLVCSAGNYKDTRVLSPARAYNSIAIGAYNDMGTTSPDDDKFGSDGSEGSSYDNLSGCMKPDLLASQSEFGWGTSTSAPVITGTIALLLQLKPSLASSPETIKAILMASCHRKAISNDPETMYEGITNQQGAGILDAYKAVSIVGRKQYVNGSINSNTTRNIIIEIPCYGAQNINFSLSWLRNASILTNHNSPETVNLGDYFNLDLSIHNRGRLINSSTNSNSSTEMVYGDTLGLSEFYTATINNNSEPTESVKYCLAWSKNNDCYRNNADLEGLFYLKNKSRNKLLTVNDDNNLIITSFKTDHSQHWVVKSNGSSKELTSNNNFEKLCKDSAVSDQSYIAKTSTVGNSIQLVENSDGSYRIVTNDENTNISYSLDLDSNHQSVVWNLSNDSETQKWYLEKSFFAFGDVDLNGTVDDNDLTTIRRHITKAVTLKGSSAYLADANCDNAIDLIDVLYLRKYLEGIENYPV